MPTMEYFRAVLFHGLPFCEAMEPVLHFIGGIGCSPGQTPRRRWCCCRSVQKRIPRNRMMKYPRHGVEYEFVGQRSRQGGCRAWLANIFSLRFELSVSVANSPRPQIDHVVSGYIGAFCEIFIRRRRAALSRWRYALRISWCPFVTVSWEAPLQTRI